MGNLTLSMGGYGRSSGACAPARPRLRALVELQLTLGAGGAGRELARPLALGVQLRAEQNRDVGEPGPDEEDHDAAERPVRLVVRAEVRDVEREGRGRDE